MIGLSTILTVYIGGQEVIKGYITPGNIAEFIIYLGLLTWPVTSLGWVTSIIQSAAASQKRLNEFLNQKSDIYSEKNIEHKIEGKLEFRNVDFVYKESNIVALKNINFTIEKGKTLAILGTTGSGKSTIANLMCRLFDPTSGEILVDDQNIKDFHVSKYRNQIGFVPQDVFLFSDSIRNNLLFGNDGLSDEQMHKYAKDADIHDNIMDFKDQYDTILGERGITLSGGQKQRVSIARALTKNPSIMIFDDCLSAVDTKTENTILNNLKKLMENKTSIIISHRVSSAKLADYIIFIDEGEIVEAGTHKELMNNNGIYAENYEKQLKSEENNLA